jgi:hypothetical protein
MGKNDLGSLGRELARRLRSGEYEIAQGKYLPPERARLNEEKGSLSSPEVANDVISLFRRSERMFWDLLPFPWVTKLG